MTRLSCIGADELRAFLLGELSEGRGRDITAHLEKCPSCETEARRLDHLADGLICSLRRALAPPGGTGRLGIGAEATLAASPSPAVRMDYPGPAPGAFGRFHLVRELGRGGFGVVYLADDPKLGRQIALKVPRPEVLADADLRGRFLREARAAARLDHPLVVPVYEVGAVGAVCFLVSAYCPGESLALWLRRQSGPVAPTTAAALLASVADAVAHAHDRGVFHRDLKPNNILLTPGTLEEGALDLVPRLTDFGLAKLLEAETDQTSSGLLLGTPVYMAPEQAEGWADAVGPATDVYALGVILYELLTRRLPCQDASLLLTLEKVRSGQPVPPRSWQANVPPDLETICLKCLEKEPAQRYATATALAEDLRRFLRHESIAARPPRLLDRLAGWCRRPERTGQAAVLGAFSGSLHLACSAAGLVLALAGAFRIMAWVPALTFFLAGMLVGVVQLALSWQTATRDPRILWAGLLVPLLFPTYLLAGMAGVVDVGGLDAHREVSMEMAQAATILLLNAVTAVGYAAALRAYYANRHRPGFFPRAMPKT